MTTRPAHNYAPWPCEADPAWRRMAARTMREVKEDLDRTPAAQLDPGNPNHPTHDGVFGYDRAAFLGRQYR